MHHDISTVIDTLPLSDHESRHTRGDAHHVQELVHEDYDTVRIQGELLEISRRFYFNEPEESQITSLSERQQKILHCIYLRHHDGFVRQHHLSRLGESCNSYIIPYTIYLLGDYVLDILTELNTHITDTALPTYQGFIRENPRYWRLIRSRMSSYWSAYYRERFPLLENYIGQQLVERIIHGIEETD